MHKVKKFYNIFTKLGLLFTGLYAFFGICDFVILKLDILNSEIPDIFNILLLIPVILLFYSLPFFLPLAVIMMIADIIMYKKLHISEKKAFTRDMILHSVFTLIGMAGIFYVYIDKFGFPSFT